MARSAKERAAEYRLRRELLREAVWIDICRETILSSHLMTIEEWNNPATRRRRLSDWIDEALQTRAFVNCHVVTAKKSGAE